VRSTRQMSITLPVEMADSVRAKVARGDYASESEVIREGLRALEAQEEAIERWLKTKVKAAWEAYEADPDSAISLEELDVHMGRLRDKLLEEERARAVARENSARGPGDARSASERVG